jgi:hypothetical protein
MSITVDELVEREVLCCMSSLVSDLAKMIPHLPNKVVEDLSFYAEDILNLVENRDYREPAERYLESLNRDDLLEIMNDRIIIDDREIEEIRAEAEKAVDMDSKSSDDVHDEVENLVGEGFPGISDDGLRQMIVKDLEDEDDFQSFCDDNRIEPHYREVYEHWAVTDWFARKLKEKGETVVELGNLQIWGRTTTGQMISMDWVTQQIHKELVA